MFLRRTKPVEAAALPSLSEKQLKIDLGDDATVEDTYDNKKDLKPRGMFRRLLPRSRIGMLLMVFVLCCIATFVAVGHVTRNSSGGHHHKFVPRILSIKRKEFYDEGAKSKLYNKAVTREVNSGRFDNDDEDEDKSGEFVEQIDHGVHHFKPANLVRVWNPDQGYVEMAVEETSSKTEASTEIQPNQERVSTSNQKSAANVPAKPAPVVKEAKAKTSPKLNKATPEKSSSSSASKAQTSVNVQSNNVKAQTSSLKSPKVVASDKVSSKPQLSSLKSPDSLSSQTKPIIKPESVSKQQVKQDLTFKSKFVTNPQVKASSKGVADKSISSVRKSVPEEHVSNQSGLKVNGHIKPQVNQKAKDVSLGASQSVALNQERASPKSLSEDSGHKLDSISGASKTSRAMGALTSNLKERTTTGVSVQKIVSPLEQKKDHDVVSGSKSSKFNNPSSKQEIKTTTGATEKKTVSLLGGNGLMKDVRIEDKKNDVVRTSRSTTNLSQKLGLPMIQKSDVSSNAMAKKESIGQQKSGLSKRIEGDNAKMSSAARLTDSSNKQKKLSPQVSHLAKSTPLEDSKPVTDLKKSEKIPLRAKSNAGMEQTRLSKGVSVHGAAPVAKGSNLASTNQESSTVNLGQGTQPNKSKLGLSESKRSSSKKVSPISQEKTKVILNNSAKMAIKEKAKIE
jgi:hypothetical protein